MDSEVGYFNDGSQYIIQPNGNGRYDARRFWGGSCEEDVVSEYTIIENVTCVEAAAAVIESGYRISESLL